MKRVLIVVDVQNDFVDGVLGSKEAQAIIPAVKAKIEKYDKYGREILFTRDSHDGDYLYTSEGRKLPIKHCIMGTRGHRIVDGLETHNSRHIDKPTFGYAGWAEVLDMLGDPDSIEMIGLGAVSTEHSVMGANFSIDGDEITFVKRLLTELYPDTSFSMVSDTYDYWNMVNNILPQCRDEIMNHNGKLLVRPDSGDIVEISVKTVERLWEIFGGTENSKGYKVLDPHIGIIYGDGCTLSNVETIWKELEKRGFAANNIAYGVGAFCFTAIVEDGKLVVATRDTFGIAMKATYGVINGKKLMIYKDPKTDTSHLKKSHKGCCRVYKEDGQLKCQDQLSEMSDDSLLTTVFKDGKLVKEESFMDIRERMYGVND